MKKLNRKRILAGFLAALMLLQDSQELLVYAADFAANVPRYVSFSAPDALEEITDVIMVETEQEALSEEEKDALVDVQLDSEAGETESSEVSEMEVLREPELVEEEEVPGEIVDYTADSITYALGAGEYMTIFGSNVGTYVDEEGNVYLEDNTLQEITTFSEDGTSVYTNTANSYSLYIPEILSQDTGMVLEQDGYTLEVLPLEGDYTKSVVKENAILYNDVYENIDIQYTVQGKNIKEDIILRERTERNTFSYAVRAEGLSAALDGQTVVLSDEEGKTIFALMAPLMSDAAGEVSLGVAITLEEKDDEYILTVTGDEEWLNAEERVYPIKIDPIVAPAEERVVALYCVAEGKPTATMSLGLSYIGYDNGIASNTIESEGVSYKRCKTYVKFNREFAAGTEDVSIRASYLYLTQASRMGGGGAGIHVSRVNNAWSPETLTWANQLTYSAERIGGGTTSNSLNTRVELDITTFMRDWKDQREENNGLVLSYSNENAQCETFYDEGVAAYSPSIVIYWGTSEEDSELSELELDDLTINLRPVTEKTFIGKLTLDAVFADGVAKADSTVTYALTDKGSGEVVAETTYAYPNNEELLSEYPNGTLYNSLESNWQSEFYDGLDKDKVYQFQATASMDGETSSTKYSDTFLIYKATGFDTYEKIAAHYGVPLETIMVDNNAPHNIVVRGSTIFIRNPQNTEPYVSAGLTDEELDRIKGFLLGFALNCVFGHEPINLNTGNFYMNQSDVAIENIGGDFAINRSYNSIGAKINSVFGFGWTFDYDEYLSLKEDGSIFYKRGDGSFLSLTQGGDGSYYAPAGYEYVLTPVYSQGNIASWKLTDENYTVKTFDAYGMLTAVSDRAGNTTTVSYDSSLKISGLTSPSGKVYQFTTDGEGRITSILLPNGASLAYAYDGSGNLSSYTNANGHTIRYVYNDSHYMLRWYDANGNCVVDNQYDSMGRVTAQTDAEGNTAYLAYNEGNTVSTDNNGNATTYYFNENKFTTKIVYPDGSVETKSYTADNYLASETDKAGNTTTYSYDGNGNLLSTTRADGAASYNTYDGRNQLLSETDFNGNKTSYSYDERGNLIKAVYADNTQVSFSYDNLNRLVKTTDERGISRSYTYSGAMPVSVTDGEGATTTYSYNAMNLLVEETDPEGNRILHVYDAEGRETQTVAGDGGSTGYEFDAAGNVLSITDARGKKTSFTYDKLGHILTGTDSLGNTLTYSYDKNYNKVKETDALGGAVISTFDALNRITAVTDQNGNKTTYELDALGNIRKETDANGNSKTYSYDTVKAVLTSETDANGNTTTYSYDLNGNLVKITYPDGGVETYTYDVRNRIASSTSVLGLETIYTYDAAGNLIQEANSLGETTTYQYNGNNQITAVTNALGNTETYNYNGAGLMTAYTDAKGAKETYAYDGAGRLIKVVGAEGGVTTTTYDLNGNVTSITDANGNSTSYTYNALNLLTSETNAKGAITAYFYDALERPVKVVDALKGETLSTYDAAGNLLSAVDANGNTYHYTYDNANRMVTITSPDGSVTEMNYDRAGNLVSMTDSLGLVTKLSYDASNRLIAQSDNTGAADTYVLDKAGNITKKTDALGRVTTYAYDAKGRQTTVTEADKSLTTYGYNAADELIQVTDAMGNVTTFAYDEAGNNISMSQSEEKVYHYSYDKLHNLISETDPLGGVTAYSYDAAGNLLEVTTPDGVKNSFAYDKVYNLVAETDGNGGITTLEYDALNRVTLQRDALGKITEYRYDAVGNVTKSKDENGHITEYVYDSMNRLVKTISPLRAVTKNTYDSHGNVLTATDALGNVTRYQYDLKDNVIKMNQADGGIYTYAYDVAGRLISTTTPLDYTVEMTYDKVDNLIKETDSLKRVTGYTYDRLHNLIKTVDAAGGVSVYDYDTYGNLISEADPLGRTTTYTYDLCDRMTEMYDPLSQVTKVSYDSVGNVTDITTPGGRTTAYSYDKNYNQTAVTDPMGYVTGYIYDKRNQLTSEVDALSQSNQYSYDAAGQLTSYTDRRGNSEHYTYDAHGNRLSYKDFAGKVTQYAYDLNNNLTKVTDANGGKTTYTYDSMNRMVTYTNALGKITRYTYDYMGNQTTITDEAGRTETSIYDEAGRQVQYVKNSGKAIEYDYDVLNDLIEKSYYSSTGETSEDAVLYGYNANGERVAMMDVTGDSTYEYDALGRIIKVTNGADKTVTYRYDEAGNLTALGYPDGTYVSYTYDLNNNLTSVTEPDGDCTTYTYDALNRVTATIRPDRTATYMTYDEESNLTVLKNVCIHCDELLSEYRYTYNEMGYVVTEEVTERISVYCGRYHGEKEHGKFWRGKGHECCQHEWFEHDDKDTVALFETATELAENASSISRKKGGRWHQNPAYLYCTCHTKLVTTKKDYVYDANWQILSATTEAAGHEIIKECYSYDEAGNRTSYERWSGHKKLLHMRYEYNSANQLVTTYEKQGWHWYGIEKTIYTYDADGNQIKEEVELRKYHGIDWEDWNDWETGWDSDNYHNWFEELLKDWFDKWFGGWFEDWFGDWFDRPDAGEAPETPTYEITYTTKTYGFDTENRLKAVREKGVLLQAMTYDGDGNLAYELDYNPGAVVDSRCIHLPIHGTLAERNLYEIVADTHGWVKGDYTLTEYLNDVTRENVEVLAEYGKNYCSATIYTYGNERISATTFNGYGYHFGSHHDGYHDIFEAHEKWHDRWQIKDHWHNKPRNADYDYFRKVYGAYTHYSSGKYCGHKWRTFMSKVYYLYDGHGTVERVHGKDGSTFRFEYDTYGNLAAGITERWHAWHNDIYAHRTTNIYAYSGERYNFLSGLQYLRARWYDTNTGRFISEDSYLGTQTVPLSRNRYIYTHNNPVNYVDPSGHAANLVIGAVVGLAVGVATGIATGDVTAGVIAGASAGIGVATFGMATAAMGTATLGTSLVAGAVSGFASSVVEVGANMAFETEEAKAYTAQNVAGKILGDTVIGAAGAAFEHGIGQVAKAVSTVASKTAIVKKVTTAVKQSNVVQSVAQKATNLVQKATSAWDKFDNSYQKTFLGELENKLQKAISNPLKSVAGSIDNSIAKAMSKVEGFAKIKGCGSEGGTATSKPNQVHHYATNKNKTYTQAFEDITSKYGLDLDADWNKDLLPHQGRHPNAYHDYVLDEMRNIDNIANGNKDIFLELYESEIKSIIRDNPDMLYSNYWKGLKE